MIPKNTQELEALVSPEAELEGEEGWSGQNKEGW